MKLLARPMPDLIHTTMGYPITMDQQAGDILRRRRYQNLLTAPVPIGNGIVDPAAQQLTALDIDARIDWYGTYIILEEQVMLINEDPVLNSAVSVLGQSLRETEDQLARSMMEGGAPPINCTSGTNGRQNWVIAVVKSLLMDLKLLTCNGEDNKAQAEQYALAA